jgi:hypothetical protein
VKSHQKAPTVPAVSTAPRAPTGAAPRGPSVDARPADAAGLAQATGPHAATARAFTARKEIPRRDDVDSQSYDSFPASDPPSWTGTSA